MLIASKFMPIEIARGDLFLLLTYQFKHEYKKLCHLKRTKLFLFSHVKVNTTELKNFIK